VRARGRGYDAAVSTTASELGPDWRTSGLTSAQVAERVAAGRTNHLPDAPTRTTAQILRANLLTPVNGIVGVLFVLVVVANGLGPDALFVGVIVANSLIGTIQEVRARAALDRLAVLNTPRATAVRDGSTVDLAVEDVVADDLLVLAPGAQVVVDGDVVEATGLELNESLLTGEIDPIRKHPGDQVLSGSFVAAGSGSFRAVAVGAESYASRLADDARRFTLVHSELRRGVNRILEFLMLAIPPVAIILLIRSLANQEWRAALTGVVAACVAMVPDGLVLLTSVAFAAGVVKLARRNALLRELASVELLARVDTLCLDKTGTITTGEIVYAGVEPIGGDTDVDERDAADLLAAVAAADPDPNATMRAVLAAHPDPPAWRVESTVPFSSARKYSAVEWSGDRAAYLGAPEILAPGDREVASAVEAQAGLGRRVMLLATTGAIRSGADGQPDGLPDDLRPRALVLLEDSIRSDAPETLAYFAEQGVDIKVISGDHPETVAAVAGRAGVPNAEVCTSARDLPEDPEALADAVEANAVFGRVTPQQKRAMVQALQSRGRTVAMTGDGVNDVLALKDADMGIAMGAGSAATRAVAQLVLLDDRFATLPGVLAEGRRVINSVERAANLFIYGTVYSATIALIVAAVGAEYPFLPRHLTVVRTLSVGLPGLVLALAPDPRRARTGFVARVVRFAIPAGLIAAAASLVVYWWALRDEQIDLVEARTATTITLLGVGLGILLRLTRSLPPWRWALVGSMAAGILLVLVVPPLSAFFELDMPSGSTWAVIAAVVVLAAVAIRLVPVTADGGEEVEVPQRT
jgi:cation-transporting ATPase E